MCVCYYTELVCTHLCCAPKFSVSQYWLIRKLLLYQSNMICIEDGARICVFFFFLLRCCCCFFGCFQCYLCTNAGNVVLWVLQAYEWAQECYCTNYMVCAFHSKAKVLNFFVRSMFFCPKPLLHSSLITFYRNKFLSVPFFGPCRVSFVKRNVVHLQMVENGLSDSRMHSYMCNIA